MIVDEPPKQCELRHAIGVLNTFSFFADDAHLDNLRKSTRSISQIRPEFLGCKEATSYFKLFS